MNLKKLSFTFSTLFIFTTLFAQKEGLKPPKPDFSFGANLILSNPIADFKSKNVSNEDAGFAEFGAGLGVFAHFEYETGFFVEINADYSRRKSTALSEIVTILEEQINAQGGNQVDLSVRENPGYRHFSLLIGPGFNFQLTDVDIYVRSEFGMAYSRLTHSSISNKNGEDLKFQKSDETVAAFGLGAGIIIYDILRFDFSFTHLGNPDFELSIWNTNGFDETFSEFNLPIQVFEIGVGMKIVK